VNDLWIAYGDNVSLKLETVHQAKAAVARMKVHGVEVEVRLNESPMHQCDVQTQKISEIRRVVKSNNRNGSSDSDQKRQLRTKSMFAAPVHFEADKEREREVESERDREAIRRASPTKQNKKKKSKHVQRSHTVDLGGRGKVYDQSKGGCDERFNKNAATSDEILQQKQRHCECTAERKGD